MKIHTKRITETEKGKQYKQAHAESDTQTHLKHTPNREVNKLKKCDLILIYTGRC